ncbi:sensor domain-containing protein [Promicromonospora sp. NPDC050262]|uniref:sensor histidine kinase n=1 Tax=Promicromonospora sp. NPDC050262 TaxID=3155036 RepID=UPI0033FCA418
MRRPDSLALALRRPGYLVSAWLPRAWLFTLTSALITGPFVILIFSGLLQSQSLYALVALLVVVTLACSTLIARLDRFRVSLLGQDRIADPHGPAGGNRSSWHGAGGGGPDRVRLRLGEAATWREVLYVAACLAVGWACAGAHLLVVAAVTAAVTIPERVVAGDPVWDTNPAGVVLGFGVAVVGLPALGYAVGLLALAQAALARSLLAPRGDELRRQIARLTASRANLVRSFEGDLRRIERDLHDGAQQKLVTLAIALGSAELDLAELDAAELARAGVDVARLRAHLDRAHDLAEAALDDLRSTVRAIHPRVLADHGLTPAVHELTSRMHVPVTLASTVEGRFDAEVELCAYFVVSEALTNVARHSRALGAGVEVARDGDVLTVRVHDDGVGGADPRAGTGLAGLRERAEAAGGNLTVTSPDGGPTTITLLLPARAAAVGPGDLAEPRGVA